MEFVSNVGKNLVDWLDFLRSNADPYYIISPFHPASSFLTTLKTSHPQHSISLSTLLLLPFPLSNKNATPPRFNYNNSNGFVGIARGQARCSEGESEGGDPSAPIHRKREELNRLY